MFFCKTPTQIPPKNFFEKAEKNFLKKLKFLENAPIYISEARGDVPKEEDPRRARCPKNAQSL